MKNESKMTVESISNVRKYYGRNRNKNHKHITCI